MTTRCEGRKRFVGVNRNRLDKANLFLVVPQSEFHKPIRAFVDRVQEEVEDLTGIVLFSSVAQREADRASDIDLLVIVRDLEDRPFEGNRYTFECLVEMVEIAHRVGEQLQEQLDERLTLAGSEDLADLRREVYADGEGRRSGGVTCGRTILRENARSDRRGTPFR